MQSDPTSRAWVEVDLDAVRENFQTVRRVSGPEAAVVPMVKADAYGLGMARVVRALEPLEPWGYGVATGDEGVALRALLSELGSDRPILLAAPLAPAAVAAAARAGLTASISDLPGLERWAEASTSATAPLEFHVEVDTGMGRAGFDWRQATSWSAAVRQRVGARLRWTGVFTHFQGADAPDGLSAAAQWERFRDVLEKLPMPRGDLLVHAANSAAALRWRQYALDAVRPGIFLYGGRPAPGVEDLPTPRPVAAVRARVLLVRDVAAGATTGYGATYAAAGPERWATLGIGYGDGLPRALGNRGEALLRGRRVPIVGRLSMDMAVVDVSALPAVEVGDVATLVGRDDAGLEIPLEDVAAQAGTISYEILTGLTPRLPRVERGGA